MNSDIRALFAARDERAASLSEFRAALEARRAMEESMLAGACIMHAERLFVATCLAVHAPATTAEASSSTNTSSQLQDAGEFTPAATGHSPGPPLGEAPSPPSQGSPFGSPTFATASLLGAVAPASGLAPSPQPQPSTVGESPTPGPDAPPATDASGPPSPRVDYFAVGALPADATAAAPPPPSSQREATTALAAFGAAAGAALSVLDPRSWNLQQARLITRGGRGGGGGQCKPRSEVDERRRQATRTQHHRASAQGQVCASGQTTPRPERACQVGKGAYYICALNSWHSRAAFGFQHQAFHPALRKHGDGKAAMGAIQRSPLHFLAIGWPRKSLSRSCVPAARCAVAAHAGRHDATL